MKSVRPADHGRALVNPMMGWVHHHYDNHIEKYGSRLEPSDALDDFPGLSTAYLRLAWAYLEPEEGRFDWSIFDGPAQRWRDRGKRIALRVSCSESGLPIATPAWVRTAGAKGHHFKPGTGVVAAGQSDLWEPDFECPIFLSKLDRFLGALADRYDGDPAVDFIDIGSFGVWGEGHTYWSSKLQYSSDAIIRHIDLHLKHFKRTQLVALWPWMDHGRSRAAYDYALARGVSMRSDSILVLPPPQLYHPEHAATIWPSRPVVLESEHYGESVSRGVWGDGSFYLKAVEEYHASYVSIHWWPREFLAACRPLIDRISMRMGYRLRPTSVTWPDRAAAGTDLAVQWSWTNAGVAPCYPGGHPIVTLKDTSGGIVAAMSDEAFDVRQLGVGPAGDPPVTTLTSRFRVPANAKPGKYDLFVSVGTRSAFPQIAMPLTDDDGHRRYRIGTLTVDARS